MKSLYKNIVLLILPLCLIACSTTGPARRPAAPLPGDAQFYSYEVSQSKEKFANIAKAQSGIGLSTSEKYWNNIRPVRSPAIINIFQIYYPPSVRWELKDGRQFLLENIDVDAIMRDYFKTHRIELPHQRQGREILEGDFNPSLVHEVKDDSVIIKWLIQSNRTPLALRRTSPPQTAYEEHPVIELKGNLTSGIDFEKWGEIVK